MGFEVNNLNIYVDSLLGKKSKIIWSARLSRSRFCFQFVYNLELTHDGTGTLDLWQNITTEVLTMNESLSPFHISGTSCRLLDFDGTSSEVNYHGPGLVLLFFVSCISEESPCFRFLDYASISAELSRLVKKILGSILFIKFLKDICVSLSIIFCMQHLRWTPCTLSISTSLVG